MRYAWLRQSGSEMTSTSEDLMIVRYCILCSGCDNDFLLRLSVAPTRETKFYVPCPHCSLPLEGSSQGYELETHEVSFTRAQKVQIVGDHERPVVTIDPNVPLRLGARGSGEIGRVGTSPNHTFYQLLGPRVVEGSERLANFRVKMEQHWPRYTEALEYYISEQWDYFERSLGGIIETEWEDSKYRSNQRHRAANLVTSLLLVPLQPDRYSLALSEDLAHYAPSAFSNLPLKALAYELELAGRLSELQANLYRVFIEYMNAWEMWLPGLTVKMTQPSMDAEIEKLRIARNDFPLLRDLYLQTCENICNSLFVVTAIVNASLRADPNSFANPPPELLAANAKETRPVSISKYDDLNCPGSGATAACTRYSPSAKSHQPWASLPGASYAAGTAPKASPNRSP